MARDYARSDLFDRLELFGLDRTLAVDGFTQRVDHAAKQLLAHRHLEDAPGTLDLVALGNVLVSAEDYRAHRISFEVQRHTEGIARKFDHLAGHNLGETVNARNTIHQADDGALGPGLGRAFEVLDAIFDEFANF